MVTLTDVAKDLMKLDLDYFDWEDFIFKAEKAGWKEAAYLLGYDGEYDEAMYQLHPEIFSTCEEYNCKKITVNIKFEPIVDEELFYGFNSSSGQFIQIQGENLLCPCGCGANLGWVDGINKKKKIKFHSHPGMSRRKGINVNHTIIDYEAFAIIHNALLEGDTSNLINKLEHGVDIG